MYISGTLWAWQFLWHVWKKMTNNVQKDKLRKSYLAYKWGRANARRQNSAKHKLQKKKQKKEKRMKPELDWACKYTERNWDHCFTIYTPRPLATKVKYDDSKCYNFLIFDSDKHYNLLSFVNYQLLTRLAVLLLFNLHLTCPWYWSFRFKSEQT